MKIIIFDLWGKFAHFRKFYTNSSSLTYSLPPRTTIQGMVAAILGYERDSYYEILNSENLNISIRKVGGTRKIMQSLNYIKATNPKGIINPCEHTQIPFEIIVGDRNINYRIYVSHKDEQIFNEIEERIINNKPCYPLYFGSAPFSCYIKYIDTVEFKYIKSDEYVPIYSAIRDDIIEEIDINSINKTILKERMPRDFGDERKIKEVTTYIYEENGYPVSVKIRNEYCSLSNNENIVFL